MRYFALLLGLQLAVQLHAADFKAHDAHLQPAPTDNPTARLTARMLERAHYLQQPLDDAISSRFLTQYIETFDRQHLFFFQSDAEEFELFRHHLDEMTRDAGDTTPAYVIFKRFLQRLDQQHDFVLDQLKNGKFDFTSDDRFLINRKDQPRPQNLAEAQKLWLDRLRFEYLQEKLNQKPQQQAKFQNKVEKVEITQTNTDGSTRPVDDATKKDLEKAVTAAAKPAKPLGQRAQIIDLLEHRYNRIWRYYHEMESDDVLQYYLTALTHSYDPHSDYMNKDEMDNFSISMRLSLVGIGAQLTSEDGYCTIKDLIPGGPAAQSKKLKPQDRIVAVAQTNNEPVDVFEMKLNKVVEMIRGTKGTEVRLTVIPADAPDPSVRKVVSLIRDEIKLEDQEAKAKLFEMPDGKGHSVRLGLIDLPSFYADFDQDNLKAPSERKSTTTDVSKLIKKLKEQKVSGIILDLRRNGGGSLEEAIHLTGLFIKEGPVVQVKDYDGRIAVDKDEDPSILYDGPLIVLTSRFSASASEILAGALQDYGRALIVGDSSTHGKGTVQNLIMLKNYLRASPEDSGYNPGALKVTIRKFYRASGASTQLKGVVPDVVLPSINNYAEVGESSLDNPLIWDTIPSADFAKLNWIQPVLPEIQKRSTARVKTDTDFKYVQEDIDRFRKQLADKTISLNEAQRRKEKQELDAQIAARKQERLARKEPAEAVYDINLKQADQPGLPPVVTAKTKTAKNVEAAAPVAAKDDGDEADEADYAPVDITLKETKRILQDLITLSPKSSSLAESKIN